MRKIGKIIICIFVVIALLGGLVAIFEIKLPKWEFSKSTETETDEITATEPDITIDESTHVWGRYNIVDVIKPEFLLDYENFSIEIEGCVSFGPSSESVRFTKISYEPADYYLVFYNENEFLGYFPFCVDELDFYLDFGEYAYKVPADFVAWLNSCTEHVEQSPKICDHSTFSDTRCVTCGRVCVHVYEDSVCTICGSGSPVIIKNATYCLKNSCWDSYEEFTPLFNYSVSAKLTGYYGEYEFDEILFNMTGDVGPYIEINFYKNDTFVASLGDTDSWSIDGNYISIAIYEDVAVSAPFASIFNSLFEDMH